MTEEKEKEKKFYTAKYDRVFKTIFCNEDDPTLLKELLERILKRTRFQPGIQVRTPGVYHRQGRGQVARGYLH